MELTVINSAIDAAYADALANGGQRVMPQDIAPNVTLQTDTYVAPTGSGFRVVCRVTVPEVNFTATRVRNHGPDTASEREWPIEGIEAAAKAHVARCIEAGAAHVISAGFDADKKVILLNKLLKAKETSTVADYPKLVALYGWMETVQQMAISGNAFFPKAPCAFDEVIAE
jgi:hypothetical protein